MCNYSAGVEPDALKEEKRFVLHSTQKLAFNNYKTFIETAECTREVFKEVCKRRGWGWYSGCGMGCRNTGIIWYLDIRVPLCTYVYVCPVYFLEPNLREVESNFQGGSHFHESMKLNFQVSPIIFRGEEEG